MYRILADIVVSLHFLWILFLIFGAFAGIRYRVLKYIHVTGLGYSLLMQLFGWYCPLTHLEFWLRGLHGPLKTSTDPFITHYLKQIVYLDVSRQAVFLLTLAVAGINLRIYLKKKTRNRH